MAFMDRVRNSFSYLTDAWAELKKVRWPSRKELISYTLVVLSTVVFVTLYFALIDRGLTELIRVFFE